MKFSFEFWSIFENILDLRRKIFEVEIFQKFWVENFEVSKFVKSEKVDF